MVFDVAIMNPPYKSGLHLKILEETTKLVDSSVCIHPAAWLQFPTRIRPSYMDGLIESFDMIERKEANDMFDIDGGDLVITTLSKDGDSFTGNAVEDKRFCCFKYNSRFAANWKIVKSIYEKVIAKCPQETFNNNLSKTAANYSLRFCLSRSMMQTPTMSNKTGGNKREEDAFKVVSKHYQVAQNQTPGSVNKFLNFKTETERKNAWASYLTKFTRFCIAMDESTKLAPYMNDYTKPWDDKRFYEYFGLTDEEIDVIEKIIR